jgi:hypothetical protein
MSNDGEKKPQAVWEVVVIRHARDREAMVAGLLLRQCMAVRFSHALFGWEKNRQASPRDRMPLCLTCDHEFHDAPVDFVMGYSEDPGVEQVILSGICARCIKEKTDVELLSRGSSGVCQIIDGKELGFTAPRSLRGDH